MMCVISLEGIFTEGVEGKGWGCVSSRWLHLGGVLKCINTAYLILYITCQTTMTRKLRLDIFHFSICLNPKTLVSKINLYILNSKQFIWLPNSYFYYCMLHLTRNRSQNYPTWTIYLIRLPTVHQLDIKLYIPLFQFLMIIEHVS